VFGSSLGSNAAISRLRKPSSPYTLLKPNERWGLFALRMLTLVGRKPMLDSTDSQSARVPLIALRGITKSFPAVLANDHVDLDIYQGEIHALLGENGAGKSVLMKILYGFYHADAGRILLNGESITIQTPHDARNVLIGMVFQDLILIPVFSVAENIALFLSGLKVVLHPKEIDRRIIEISESCNLKVDLHA
jgi:ABC-type uncharacterized transport system ATPase subunit